MINETTRRSVLGGSYAEDHAKRQAERMIASQRANIDRLHKPITSANRPSDKQINYVGILLDRLATHNPTVHATAAPWWDGVKDTITWMDLKTLQVIDRLKAHLAEPVMMAHVHVGDDGLPTAPMTMAPVQKLTKFDTYEDVTDGNYAIEREGKTHFYRISRKEGKGKYAGRKFIKIQERASDTLFDVRGVWSVRARILDQIRAAGIDAAHMMYADRLGRCWHCHASLTDDTGNPHRSRGLGPYCGENN